ncbi:hypothetical protein [Stratiformator vulcanicus]|uniref:Uncharacterized protein n=1 Tax=Stratiformator vulcanicus TaxID=2527980 RepID=A0A517R339_9PLAN|nr:hypothetical protein [Stratiformator vulcanicus]QDT38299.1 hypothetical protein Pan189_26900 [Stratiformator vulcanicus]
MREILTEHLRRQPFVPFEVILSSGDRYVVSHPENAALTRGRMFVTDPATEKVVECFLLHIASVEVKENQEV